MSDDKVKGPASYFPSIEKTYGHPIAEWKALIHARPPSKHMELVAWLKAEAQLLPECRSLGGCRRRGWS